MVTMCGISEWIPPGFISATKGKTFYHNRPEDLLVFWAICFLPLGRMGVNWDRKQNLRMVKLLNRFVALLLCVFPLSGTAQSLNDLNLLGVDPVEMKVTENGNSLLNPWLGGMNLPQFSFLQTDGTGPDEIMTYDRSSSRSLRFFKENIGGNWQYKGEFFPLKGVFENDSILLMDWALFRDFDLDGVMDFFGGSNGGVRLYKGIPQGTGQYFTLFDTLIKTVNDSGTIPLYVAQADIPAILDVDGDGDLDVLAFDGGGSYVEFHRNYAFENTGQFNTMELRRDDGCWGKFFESGLSNILTLNATCKGGTGMVDPQSTAVHAGSTVAAFDATGNGALDIFLGDLLYSSILMGRNNQTSTNGHIDTVFYGYPAYDTPVDLYQFPAAYFGDVDEDGKTDLIAAPNASNISLNNGNVWYYHNDATGPAADFSLQEKSFLVGEMLDAGTGSHPAFIDYDGDGDEDLVIGNYTLKTTGTGYSSSLFLYLQLSVGGNGRPEWELVDDDWLGVTNAFSPAISGLSPAFGDMDGDGDVDLLLGDSDGKIHYYRNDGGAGNPAQFVLAQGQYMGIDVGQSATPAISDINRDGKPDLVIGEQAGNLNYFENIGTPSAPLFSATANSTSWGGVDVEPVCCSGSSAPYVFDDNLGEFGAPGLRHLLVGSERGRVFAYADLDAQLGGNFVASYSPTFFGKASGPGFTRRSTLASTVLNGQNHRTWFLGHISGGITAFTHPAYLSVEESTLRPQWAMLFPNPTQRGSVLQWQAGTPRGEGTLTVVDLAGKVVMERTVKMGENVELAAPQSAGVYFVRVQMPQGVQVLRWVIQP